MISISHKYISDLITISLCPLTLTNHDSIHLSTPGFPLRSDQPRLHLYPCFWLRPSTLINYDSTHTSAPGSAPLLRSTKTPPISLLVAPPLHSNQPLLCPHLCPCLHPFTHPDDPIGQFRLLPLHHHSTGADWSSSDILWWTPWSWKQDIPDIWSLVTGHSTN